MTTQPCKGAHDCNTGPLWLHQRTLGKNKPQRMRFSHDLVRGMKIEGRLMSEHGTPRCLDWNQRGDLLASGRSDGAVVVWDVFKRQEKCQLQSHYRSIWSTKFMLAANDNLVVTSSEDGDLRLTDLTTNECSCICKNPESRSSPIRDLAVHPSEPNMIWSISSPHLMQHDIRQAPESRERRVLTSLEKLLLNLCRLNWANCIAINPMRSQMLAVGSRDAYTRLFDRRNLKLDASQSCTAQFVAVSQRGYSGDGLFSNDHLAFSRDGTELLASYSSGYIHLFKTYEPWEQLRPIAPEEMREIPLSRFDEENRDRVQKESQMHEKSFYHSRRYSDRGALSCCGGANFFGEQDEFVVSSTRNGCVCIWDKNTTNLVEAIEVKSWRALPHPNLCMLAIHRDLEDPWTEDVVELWSPTGGTNLPPIVLGEMLAC